MVSVTTEVVICSNVHEATARHISLSALATAASPRLVSFTKPLRDGIHRFVGYVSVPQTGNASHLLQQLARAFQG